MSTDVLTKLQAPFEEIDIEWKSQTVGVSAGGNPYVLAVPYVTNRAIQKRLDEVFGVFGWENVYKPSTDGKGYLCGITVHVENKSVTKWDGADCTTIEPLKGGLSNSMKRAAVQLGIGRYLYNLPEFWAECKTTNSYRDDYGNVSKAKGPNKVLVAWKNPSMPVWALPVEDYTPYFEAIKNAEDIETLKVAFTTALNLAKTNQDQKAMDKAVNLKDARKVDLQSTTEKALYTCIESAVKFYEMIPSVVALDNAHKSQLTKLKSLCGDAPVDVEFFAGQLNQAYENKKEDLKGAAA